jgi:hypothetical protein
MRLGYPQSRYVSVGAEESENSLNSPLTTKGRDLADVHGVVAHPLEGPRDHRHVHGPLAGVGVVADLDRELEDLAVETVDLAILAHQVLGQGHVAGTEGRARLHDLRARRPPHAQDAIELLEDHVDPAEGRFLQALELLLEVLAPLAAHQPNFPVTYSSVRLSSGVEKILSVAACSIISPASMKAVVSATRAACCMLCVTMTIV